MNLERLLNFTQAKQTSKGDYLAHCPAHDDKDPSLSISIKNGKPLVYCFAGCQQNAVVNVLKENNVWPSVEVNSPVSFVGENTKESNNTNEKVERVTELYCNTIDGTEKAIAYFNSRGLKDVDPSLLKEVKYLQNDRELIFPIKRIDNEKVITGILRIKLDSNGKNLKNENGKNIKLMFGSISGACFSWGDIYNTETVAVTEGIETGLAVNLTTKIPTICLLSTSGLRSTKNEFPSKIKTIYVFEDKDLSSAGRKAATEFATINKDRVVLCCTPPLNIPNGDKGVDFLDVYNENPSLILKSVNDATLLFWEKPKSLDYSLPKPTKLSSNDLPKKLYDYIQMESNLVGINRAYFVPPIIIALSTLVSRIYVVQPNKKDDRYLESPNLYGAIVAPPGLKKSAIFRRAYQDFLRKVDVDNIKADLENHTQTSKFKNEKIELEKKIRSLKNSKTKVNPKELEKLEEELKTTNDKFVSSKKTLQAICLNHMTEAALVSRASKTNKTIAIFRDELSGLFSNFKDKFSLGLRQIILEGWNGLDNFIKETKLDGREEIELLSLTLLGGIQPSKIRPILSELNNGINDDGLIYRIQVLVYPDHISEECKGTYSDAKCIMEITNIFYDLNSISKHIKVRKKINFSSEAQLVYEKFRTWIDMMLNDNSVDNITKGYIAKFPTLFCSLAVIFQAVEVSHRLSKSLDFEIDKDSADKAREMSHYFLCHIKRMIYFEVNRELSLAKSAIEKIRIGKLKTGMKIRDIYRHEWSGFKDCKEVIKGLQQLEEMQWIKFEEHINERGGPHSESIRINPLIIRDGVDKYFNGSFLG